MPIATLSPEHRVTAANLLAALDGHAERRGDAPFLTLIADGKVATTSFAEFRAEALRFAGAFRAQGLAPGAVIFIVLKHRAELYGAFIGAMYAGLIPSFLPFPTPKQDKTLYWDNHRALFARVEPAAILSYSDNLAPLAAALGATSSLVMDVDALPPSAPESPAANVDEARTALLQHSSGTTGLKKGVMLSFADIRLQVESYADAIAMSPADTVVTWLPLYHDMGLLSSFLTPLTVGARIVSIDAFEWVSRPIMLLELIERYRGTLSWLPNFAFNHMARLADPERTLDLGSLRALISCSEPCKADTFEGFVAAFGHCGVRPEHLLTCYAMAETVFAVTQSTLGRPVRATAIDGVAFDTDGTIRFIAPDGPGSRRYLSNGPAVSGLEVRIARDDGADLAVPGVRSARAGEIQVRGDFLFDGYYRNPDATASAFDGEWYRTGDVGFVDDGELFICGRLKEMLIVHGRNYYATDIEEAVNLVAGVKPGRAVAFAEFNARTQSEEAIVVAESDLAEGDHAALRRAIKQRVFDRLELQLQTVRIVAPGWLVKTTSGKISRKENATKHVAG